MSLRCSESPYTPTTCTTSGLKLRAASFSSSSQPTFSADGTSAAGRSAWFTVA